jgi:hypothetical protein
MRRVHVQSLRAVKNSPCLTSPFPRTQGIQLIDGVVLGGDPTFKDVEGVEH